MKLSVLYNASPFKRMYGGQYAPRSHAEVTDKATETPKPPISKGKSSLERKHTYPGSA